jgi:hypothetical protein
MTKRAEVSLLLVVSSVSVRYPLRSVSAVFTARRIPDPPRRPIRYRSTYGEVLRLLTGGLVPKVASR